MNTISTTKLGKLIGLPVSIDFLKNIGVKPIYQTGYRTAMWDENDLNHILMEMGLHFINKANTKSSLVAPHGYKKNGEPSKKRGRPSKFLT